MTLRSQSESEKSGPKVNSLPPIFISWFSLYMVALSPPEYGKEKKSSEPNKGGNESEPLNMESRSQQSAEVGDSKHQLRSGLESPQDSKHDFASFYLRRVTEELADELDKIRSANDFSESSLPILIHALQQGQNIFSEEEKRRVMGET